MPRRTSVVMQTQGVTLHLERESTHQGVVMTMDNRATGRSVEELATFEEAHEKWGILLHLAATELHALSPRLVERDERGRRVRIEDEE